MNPILNRLNGNAMAQISELKSMLSGNNPSTVMQMMMQSNPQFKQFVNENRGLSTDEIARKYGIDASMLNQFR